MANLEMSHPSNETMLPIIA